MGIVVVLFEEVDVVRGDDADVELLREFEDALCDELLAVEYAVGRAVHLRPDARLVLHYLKGVGAAEAVLVPSCDALGLVHPSRDDRACDLARKAGARYVQPFAVFLEEVRVDARPIVHSVYVRFGDEPDEVVVALDVERVDAEVAARLVPVAGLVVHVGEVRLAAEDRLYVDVRELAVRLLLLRAALVVERLEREEVAVVRHGQSGHAPLACAPYERHDLALPVEERVRRVEMKMYEIAFF